MENSNPAGQFDGAGTRGASRRSGERRTPHSTLRAETSADVAGPLGYLGHDCPYGTPGRGKQRVSDVEFRELWPHIWRILRSWGVPNFVHHAHFLDAMLVRTGREWELVAMDGLSDQPFATDTQQMRLRAVSTSPHA